ncbi:MAG: PrgI family protein, partial [Lachnospiraceae bacterium]|nr:PrgI family protein [Lachnospiraceae bacterium]
AALIGVPSFFLIKSVASLSVAAFCMIAIMMPFFFMALYEKNGQPLEVILKHFIEATFIRPKQRPYKTNNYYSALERQADAEKKIKKIVDQRMLEISLKEEKKKERRKDK